MFVSFRDVQNTGYAGKAIITRCGRTSQYRHILFDPEKLTYAGEIKIDMRWKCQSGKYYMIIRGNATVVGCKTGYLDLYDVIGPTVEDTGNLTIKLKFRRKLNVIEKFKHLLQVFLTSNGDIIAVSQYTDMTGFRTYSDISINEKHNNYTRSLYRIPTESFEDLGYSAWHEVSKCIHLAVLNGMLITINLGPRTNTCIDYVRGGTVIYPVFMIGGPTEYDRFSNCPAFVISPDHRLLEANFLMWFSVQQTLKKHTYTVDWKKAGNPVTTDKR